MGKVHAGWARRRNPRRRPTGCAGDTACFGTASVGGGLRPRWPSKSAFGSPLNRTISALSRVPSASRTPRRHRPASRSVAPSRRKRNRAPRASASRCTARRAVHPALDRPDAARLGMPDEPEDRGAEIGGAADIGGVAPEKLPQPRVRELQPQGLRERQPGAMDGISEGAFITWAVSAASFGAGSCMTGASKVSNSRRALSEKRGTPPPPSGRRNRGQPRAQVGVSVKVERASIAPPVPREDVSAWSVT
jgi:hypothetical protein